ncbi:MAG: ABC transporter substrate-binding protein [Chloroflexi bacterium]|nr:ABC transporter substrate-binding protein [Chloroflexota bacterium]MCI0864181.1 ABC transporter substrate-binding protein [Chloroflexota bacterium]
MPTAMAATEAPPVTGGDAKYGGVARMSAYADTKDWDPKGSSSLSSIQAVSQLYNQIVQMDTTDTALVVCDLCDSWEVSNAGETFTFKIRDGIKWIDGSDLTAEDVLFSMRRYGDLDGPTGRSGLWRNYTQVANAGGVNLIDDLTIEFNLQFASGAFIKFLAVDYVKVLPKKLLESGIDMNQAESIMENKSGSGPFILEEYQRGNFYKVSKNENYFKEGRPFFDGIDHFIITDTGTLIAQFKADQLDMSNGGFTNLSPTQAFELEADTNGAIRPVAVSPSADWGLMMNVKKEPFNDPRVREAIQLAIDYQQWNSLVFDDTSGVGCPLMGLAHTFEECLKWPGLRPKDGPGGAEDIAKAKQLMIDAGFPDGFKTRYDVRQVGTYPDQCAVVKEQLKKVLGITGDITSYPSAAGYSVFGTSRAADSDGDWELACQGEGQVVLDVDGIMGGVYLKGATRNYTDWSNPQVDAWFEQQKSEPDPAKRREINKEMETFLFSQQDNHWITLGWGILQWMIGEDIRGFNAPETVQTHFKHEDLWLDR